MKTILLDTNSYSLLIKGDRSIKKMMEASETVYISVISIGELYAGFLRGKRFEENSTLLQRFIAKGKVKIVKIGSDTAKIYGRITCELFKIGTPIPTNDIWIAAQVVETGSELVTYDKHFLKIKDLKIWSRLT